MSEHAGEVLGGGNPPWYHFVHRVSLISAAIGGVIIFAAAIIVTFSVVKGLVGFGSIRGEFELVELACAACASLFLPLCQLTKGHVMVDVFTTRLPESFTRKLDGFWILIFALAWAFVCWRLCIGLIELNNFGDRTMLLRVPVWWAYVPAIFGTGLSSIIAVLSGVSHLRDQPMRSGEL